jgi:hypothetical protein
MKYILVSLVSGLLGAGGMYLYMASSVGSALQMSYEINLSNNLRYIEILDNNNSEKLKQTLELGVSCARTQYEEGLDSFFWERSEYSEELIKKLKKYNNETSCNV